MGFTGTELLRCRFHRNSGEVCVNGYKGEGSVSVLPQRSEQTRLINLNTVFQITSLWN